MNKIELRNDVSIYLIVKQFPPIILKGEPEVKPQKFIPKWKPKKVRIQVDPETLKIYDRDEEVEIDRDCAMFYNYVDALKYCSQLNKSEERNGNTN